VLRQKRAAASCRADFFGLSTGKVRDLKINGVHHRSIRVADDQWSVEVIDQTLLPHGFEIARLRTLDDAARAIKTMQVRGAPLIGATAAYGVCLALRNDASDAALDAALACLAETRPTAVNLRWALAEMDQAVRKWFPTHRLAAAYAKAAEICDDDVETCRRIGEHGLGLIRGLAEAKPGATVNILTHCNAGWLATVDWGTALSPIYHAHDAGLPVHVWVDETRPRNQGAALTAFELGAHGVPHTIIADNAGGHLMQHGKVDMCIVGTDRVTATGDVANKIGTYLKALAAHDNGVPFYVALPYSTIDWSISDGVREIPIEERGQEEVTQMKGRTASGDIVTVEITAPGSPAGNPAFDVTPARLVTGLITERGVCPASREGLALLYPEHADSACHAG
jgi:methylthioribose-1-phosphate isomerase